MEKINPTPRSSHHPPLDPYFNYCRRFYNQCSSTCGRTEYADCQYDLVHGVQDIVCQCFGLETSSAGIVTDLLGAVPKSSYSVWKMEPSVCNALLVKRTRLASGNINYLFTINAVKDVDSVRVHLNFENQLRLIKSSIKSIQIDQLDLVQETFLLSSKVPMRKGQNLVFDAEFLGDHEVRLISIEAQCLFQE